MSKVHQLVLWVLVCNRAATVNAEYGAHLNVFPVELPRLPLV